MQKFEEPARDALKECIMTQKKEGIGGGRWEIIEKEKRNIILIKKCV